jgi:hypothetical protein
MGKDRLDIRVLLADQLAESLHRSLLVDLAEIV